MEPAEELGYATIHLDGLLADVTLVRALDGVYAPISQLCQALGITNKQAQVTRLREDPRFGQYVRVLPVLSSRGYREPFCLRHDRVEGWLTTLNTARMLPGVRAVILPLQVKIDEVAHALMREPLHIAPRPRASVQVRGEIFVECPACRAPIVIVLPEGGSPLVVLAEGFSLPIARDETPEPEDEE